MISKPQFQIKKIINYSNIFFLHSNNDHTIFEEDSNPQNN